MNRKIIVIGGYLASGKSSFALRLSKETGIPYLMKDTFKIALCEHTTIENGKESSRFSTAAFDGMMYVAERMFEAGYPLIIEGNFVPAGVKSVDEEGVLRQLIDRYGYTALTYQFMGDTQALYRRFMEREKTPERGEANIRRDTVTQEKFEQWCHNLDAFHLDGETIKVDTTSFAMVDFEGLLESAKRFLADKSAHKKTGTLRPFVV